MITYSWGKRMRYAMLLFLILVSGLACNLSITSPAVTPLHMSSPTDSPRLLATITLISDDTQPTMLPLPGLPLSSVSATSVPKLGALCEVYITYSGARSDNKLSLRSAPSTDALQLFRVPNHVQVLRLPGSQEVEAEGYHWLNVIYEASSQMRYLGWIARDSYEVNGVRDTSIATLQQSGTQRSC